MCLAGKVSEIGTVCRAHKPLLADHTEDLACCLDRVCYSLTTQPVAFAASELLTAVKVMLRKSSV